MYIYGTLKKLMLEKYASPQQGAQKVKIQYFFLAPTNFPSPKVPSPRNPLRSLFSSSSEETNGYGINQ